MSQSVYQAASNLIASAANQAIVSPLGDPYTLGISGLIFDIVGEVSVDINSEITDHYVEQNYAIQDHWAQKPIIVTLQGYAAEVVNVYRPNIISEIFTTLTGLVPLSGLGPTFNAQDSQFYVQLNNISQLGQNIINTALTAFQIFGQAATLVTKQQTVFQFLLNMWQTRQLCTVETPYAIFQNMAIESIRPTQSAETTKVSEFIVRFKQILTVASIQGTSNPASTVSQNSGTNSTIPPAASLGLKPYVSNPVSLGTGYGSITNSNGSTISVPNNLQSIYQQQANI